MSEIIKPASMSDVSQQIIDIIEANKQTPGIAAFLQALKPALVRYSGNDVMKMNERLVSMINEINSEQTGAPLISNSEQVANPEEKKSRDFVFKPADFQFLQTVSPTAPNVETVLPDDGMTDAEREDQAKANAPILKMYREGFQKAKEINLKTFIELTQTMGMQYEKMPVSINGAWKLFENFARIKLGI